MSNSIMISSDSKSLFLTGKRDEGRLFIDGNGLLLSVLGNSIVGAEVPSQLRNHLAETTKDLNPFYELDITQAEKNYASINYSEESNAVFVIGITDIDINREAVGKPFDFKPDQIVAKGLKLKNNNVTELQSNHVVFIKTEISRKGKESVKVLKFYSIQS